jgi:hypothetical protein
MDHIEDGTYSKGCRCPDCTAVHNARIARRRAERAARRFSVDFEGTPRWVHPDADHGTDDGYTNWLCRCPACTSAHSKVRKEWVSRVS